MIAFMLLTAVTAYCLFARFVVRMVYADTGSKRSKWIAIGIFWLIPFGDVLLGYPVYWYLCHFKAGVKIYRTVDNVEGGYVGEKNPMFDDFRYTEFHGYEKYRYLDYRNEKTGRYYRLYWSKKGDPLCMPPKYPGDPYDWYAAIDKTGRCIAKKEIPDGQVSRWGYYNGRRLKDNPPDEKFGGILSFEKEYIVTVVDRINREKLAEGIDYWWSGGWLYLWLSSLSPGKGIYCHGDDYSPYDIAYIVLKPAR